MPYQVRSVIFADETRFEMDGREILIGVFNDGAIFATFPATLDKLFVRVSVLFDHAAYKTFNINMVSDSGRVVFNHSAPINPIQSIEAPSLFGFSVRPIAFPAPETINVEIGIDEPPKLVSTFTVRAPRNPQEQARVRAHDVL